MNEILAESMLGLYIHMPFCVQKCRYCDFLSFSDANGRMEEYIAALIAEIALLQQTRPITSVFIGGGTPSIAPMGAIERILGAVSNKFSLSVDAEITIESNPGTLTKEKLNEYRAAGCNRLSIGAQTTHDELLARIGRIHTANEIYESVACARAAGFQNINVDLMRALPGQSVAQHLASVQTIAELDVEHISVYSLILEEETPLYDAVARKEESVPSQDAEYEMEHLGIELLRSYGYERYEVSNYAKNGKRCRHNMNYWLCGEYMAAGLGASSAVREDGQLIRRKNFTDMNAYIDSVHEGNMPLAETQRIDMHEEMFEVVMLSLRLCEGLNAEAFTRRFGVDLRTRFGKSIRYGCDRELLTFENGFLKLTERGMEIQNTVLLQFMDE